MRLGQAQVEPEHLLLGLIHDEASGATRLLDRLGIATSQVRDALGAARTGNANGSPAQSQLSPATKKIVDAVLVETEQHDDEPLGTEHLLLALLRGEDNKAKSALWGLGVGYDRARNALAKIVPEREAAHPEAPPARPVQARPGFLRGRDFLETLDLSPDEIGQLFELTREIKSGHVPPNGRGKSLALIFEKPSLRTRVTFSVAMARLGGQSIYLSPQDIGLSTRETVPDVARCLSRWVDVIVARTFRHDTLQALAAAADIPVVNGLTDQEHPCQALADFYTILENKSQIEGMKLAFVGDGNNVAQSLMLLAPTLGAHFTLACPPGYEPQAGMVEQARALAQARGTRFELTSDACEAADAADVLYTDVWTSMGQEEESGKRARDFAGFQLNDTLVREAKEDVLVMHCLPAHRGQEITDDVLDGPRAGIWDQAENRLHVQMALLAAIF